MIDFPEISEDEELNVIQDDMQKNERKRLELQEHQISLKNES